MTLEVQWIIALPCLLSVGLVFAYTLKTGIGPNPSPTRVIENVLKTLHEGAPGLGGTLYELGSGWGSLAFPLARQFPGLRIIGIELSPIPYLFSRARALITFAPNLTFKRANFFSVPLHSASAVVCYLYPRAMKKLKTKLESELRPGSWLVSHTFAMQGWTPLKVSASGDLFSSKVYFYSR